MNIETHDHNTGEVMVTVFYQSGDREKSFKRDATVEDILTWAIDVYEVDPSLATELELARHGQKEELSLSERLGHLAGKNDELELDLIRGDIANGDLK